MLVDSHCHLDRLDLFGDPVDLDAVLKEAECRDVRAFLAIGVDLASSQKLIALANQRDDTFVAVGAHPLQDEPMPVPSADELKALAAHDCVVAVGETGLDYHYSAQTADWQQQSFVRHLQVARELGKPVVVHTRQAQEDTLALIREHGCRASGGVLHCFTESWDMARAALDLNYYISFSGIITFRNAAELREVVKQVPLERMLVETDSPWLAPVPYRGKPNRPGYVVEVASMIAELKGLTPEQVAAATTANFQALFKVDLSQQAQGQAAGNQTA